MTVVFLTLNFGKPGTKCFTCLHSFNILLIILWLSLLSSPLLFVLNLSSSSYREGNWSSEDFSNSPQFMLLISSWLCHCHFVLATMPCGIPKWESWINGPVRGHLPWLDLKYAPPPLHGLALPLRASLPAFLLVGSLQSAPPLAKVLQLSGEMHCLRECSLRTCSSAGLPVLS